MSVSSKVVTVKAAARLLAIWGISSSLAIAPTFAAVSPDLVSQSKPGDTKSSVMPAEWTYLVLWAATHPSPFEGSDGRSNLVYDLVMTNFSAQPGSLKEIEITNGETGKSLLSLSGKSLQAVVTKIGDNGLRFAPCECAMLWINLSFDKKSELPTKLKHHVVFDSVDQDNNPKTYSYNSTINVEVLEPVVVGPPLKGGKWLALGGYSGNYGHRRALFPLSNHLYAAQTYAIDWVKLDNENNQIEGDRKNVENTIGYGQPVLAVNDATVFGVIDRFDDQPMDKAVGPERLQYPTGNTVILDLGHGYYATYAHLKRGSIKVKEGEQVSRGQQIALIGNSGNSTGPHLHFQVTKGPGPLDAAGIPYVIDAFEQAGEVQDIEKFMQLAEAPKSLPVTPSKYDGKHAMQLPREATVVKFPE